MSVSMASERGKGGRKTLNAELNLVPFIDLLVCCICFLLITAVWVNMARIGVDQTSRGAGTKAEAEQKLKTRVKVLVDEMGYTVVAGAQRIAIPRQGAHDDTLRLRRMLRDARAGGAAPTLTVASVDGVSVSRLIAAMDVAKSANFSRLRLVDAAE